MMKLNRLLLPTDFSRCADQALTHAIHLARQYDAELHMLHAVVLHGDDPANSALHFPEIEELRARMMKAAATKMTKDLSAYPSHDLRVKQAQVRGFSTAPAIFEYAKHNDIDLIVMGTHGRRGLGHLLLGSVAEEVVRLASVPVLTVRERETPKPFEKVRRILAPVDFSQHARQALRYAMEIAAAYDARLQLLHVVEEAIHPAFYSVSVNTWYQQVPELMTNSKREMEKMLDEVDGPAVPHEIHVVEGHAVRDIIKFAETYNTDLIVIATHGLTGIEHLLLGSTTEKVVRIAPCPVLTVKAFGKSLI